jgi:hypothetical protein
MRELQILISTKFVPIVCYALFIYLLNLFLAFLQPKFDPSLDADLAEQDVEEGEPGLPTSSAAYGKSGKANGSGGLMSGVFGQNGGGAQQEDEFKPFIRRLPEFKVRDFSQTMQCSGKDSYAKRAMFGSLLCYLPVQFWLGATQATLISLVCTFFSVFDIPVVSVHAVNSFLKCLLY